MNLQIPDVLTLPGRGLLADAKEKEEERVYTFPFVFPSLCGNDMNPRCEPMKASIRQPRRAQNACQRSKPLWRRKSAH